MQKNPQKPRVICLKEHAQQSDITHWFLCGGLRSPRQKH